MNQSDPNCKQFEPLLDAFHDSELEPASAKEVESHLAICPSCQAKLAGIEDVVASLKALPKIAPARNLSQDLAKIVAAKKNAKVVPLKRIFVLTASAALVTLMILAIYIMQVNHQPQITQNNNQDAGRMMQRNTNELGKANKGLTDQDTGSKLDNNSSTNNNIIAENATEGKLSVRMSTDKKSPNKNTPTPEKVPEKTIAQELNNQTLNETFPTPNEDLEIAALNDRNNTANQIGIATDEDGLYAIKLQ